MVAPFQSIQLSARAVPLPSHCHFLPLLRRKMLQVIILPTLREVLMAGSKQILFVEDDHAISEMYARILTKSGYQVDFAYDGRDGLNKALNHHYDMILLDIMMPELTGLEV